MSPVDHPLLGKFYRLRSKINVSPRSPGDHLRRDTLAIVEFIISVDQVIPLGGGGLCRVRRGG